jgi:hypothetical protein
MPLQGSRALLTGLLRPEAVITRLHMLTYAKFSPRGIKISAAMIASARRGSVALLGCRR